MRFFGRQKICSKICALNYNTEMYIQNQLKIKKNIQQAYRWPGAKQIINFLDFPKLIFFVNFFYFSLFSPESVLIFSIFRVFFLCIYANLYFIHSVSPK